MSILMDALKVKAQSHSEASHSGDLPADATEGVAEHRILLADADRASHKAYRAGDVAAGRSSATLLANIQQWPLHPSYVGAVLLLSGLVAGGIWAGYWLGQQGGVRQVAATLLSTSGDGGVTNTKQGLDAVNPVGTTTPLNSDAPLTGAVLPSSNTAITTTATTNTGDVAPLVATPGLILAELSAVPTALDSDDSFYDAQNSYIDNSDADHHAVDHHQTDSGYIGGLDDVSGTTAGDDADMNAYLGNELGMDDKVAQAMPYADADSASQSNSSQHSQNPSDAASSQTLSAQDAAYLAKQAELMRAEQLKAAFSAALAQQGLAAPQGLKTPAVSPDVIAERRQAPTHSITPHSTTTATASAAATSTHTETVPVDLATSFQQALQAVPARSTPATAQRASDNISASKVPDLRSLPTSERQQVPQLRVEAHIYASVASARYVKINGKTLQQGQWVTPELQLIEVGRDYLVLQRGERQFSLPALTDWLGEP